MPSVGDGAAALEAGAFSATKRCNSAVASGFVPRNVRDNRRGLPVTASGSDVVCNRHTPGDRSVIEPVLGFTTHRSEESHPNRTNGSLLHSQRAQGLRDDCYSTPWWSTAPERTRIGSKSGVQRCWKPTLTWAFSESG